MNNQIKQVTYQTKNSYETLNVLSEKTKNVWIVLHGIGYLSRYFITYFDALPADENYIICPQAPSKYYLKNEYKHVGASWLTKENTLIETKNVINYLEAVYDAENIPKHLNLIVFGFSQGVSIATRWVAKKKIACSQLVLYAGGIPKELRPEHFTFLKQQKTHVSVLVGDQDEYINASRLKEESKRIVSIFGEGANQIVFEGGHEIKKELVLQFAT